MTALAVMVALVGAMFVAMGSVSAAPAIVFNTDTDSLVKSGTIVEAQLKDGETVVPATWTVEVGLLVVGGASGELTDGNATTPAVATARATSAPLAAGYISTKGTADGEYKVVATADGKDYETTLEVGDPGTNVGSISLSLGRVGHSSSTSQATDGSSAPARATDTNNDEGDDAPDTYEDCAQDGDDSTSASTDEDDATANTEAVLDGCIAVTVMVKNSLGDDANASGITGIDVYAPLATIVHDAATSPEGEDVATDGSAQVAGAANSAKFFIARQTPGTVEVTAFVRGADGFKGTETPLTLTFTGSAASIAVEAPTGPVSSEGTLSKAKDTDCGTDSNNDAITTCDAIEAKGSAKIVVSAMDKSGNPASAADVSLEIKNSDSVVVSGDRDSDMKVLYAMSMDGLKSVFEVTGNKAAAGVYTGTVTFGTQKETVEIVVAGDPANLELTTDVETVAVGDFVIATATVTDKDGNLQPDAGVVTFTTSGALKLVALDDDSTDPGVQRMLNDGVATLEYWVSDGSGVASIIARVGGVRGVDTVSTEAADAMPEEEAGLSCLSSLSGFSTWTCDVEASASEIFDWISSRGATALHLNSNRMWVRYSVVDGAMVPGSSDFMVTKSDILYISN